ncbi:MAG TPA: trypsin-like peptidase domain-containing protein [Myxococcota bacterium]|jgi:S1-C subfamily serine protease|nr:trypsin-like peptidase domain-containing protein [Myxococcota bacterium]
MHPRLAAGPALWLAASAALVASLAAPAGADDPFLRRTATVRAVERVGPSVVNITTEQAARGAPFRSAPGAPGLDWFFRDFFEPRFPSRTQSLGSGVVIDAERHVLTNEHVVAAADRIRVTLADGRQFGASLVGADPNNDLAVLRLETGESVPWTAPASSADVMVGEPVIAIGNPFGLSNSVTTGVLSAVDRSLRSQGDRVFHGFLQTDASINPGNSGGPLLNAEGELIGINTAIYNGAQGIGFAIPIDTARRVVRELITHGEIVPVWLGLDFQDLDAHLAEALALPAERGGALVSRVRPGGPGAAAGVRRGDLLVAVDGRAVRGARDVYELLEHATPEQELALELLRGGEQVALRARAAPFPPALIPELAVQLLGLELEPLDGGGYRAKSVREGSGAAQIGIEPGDLVLALNGRALEDAGALRRAVIDLLGRPRALVVVQRGRGRYHVTVPLGG